MGRCPTTGQRWCCHAVEVLIGTERRCLPDGQGVGVGDRPKVGAVDGDRNLNRAAACSAVRDGEADRLRSVAAGCNRAVAG
jgi:hypothetical protein